MWNTEKKMLSPRLKWILTALAFIGITGCVLVFIPQVRTLIIAFVERYLVHRPLNNVENAHSMLLKYALSGLTCCLIFLFIVVMSKKYNLVHLIAEEAGNSKAKHIITIVCLIVIAVNSLEYIDIPVATTDLDPSWRWAINKLAHNQDYMWGKDITFTYGPLGYLFAACHYSDTLIQGFLFSLLCLGLLVTFLYINCRKHACNFHRLFIFVVFVCIFAGMIPIEWRWNLTLLILFMTCWLFRDEKHALVPLSIIAGILSAFSLLLKFNTAAFAGCLAVVLGCMFLFFDRKKTLVYAIVFAVAYTAVAAIAILICFKSIDNFIFWIRMSLEVAGGFSYAMVINGNPLFLLIAFALIAYYGYTAILLKNIGKNCFGLFLLGCVVIFFSFKHGFVRQDSHMTSFFATMPFLTGFIFLFFSEAAYKKLFALFKTTFLVCFFCMLFISPGSIIFGLTQKPYNLFNLKENLQSFNDRKISSLEKDLLPVEWNGIIGSNSIQILPWELSYAAANQWTGWQPNPVLQLYSVYTKKLDEYSALSFMEARAPDFILLEYNAIDGRNMFLDIPATWNTLIPNYTPLEQDETRLLLKRNDTYSSFDFSHIRTERYRFNETISIPQSQSPVYAKIQINNSILGKIITTLFRSNPSTITITHQNGETLDYRVIADTLKNPVRLDYIPHDFSQMVRLLNGEDAHDTVVTEIRFSNKMAFLFQPTIAIEWLSITD
jgi:hypothetical protein